MTNFSTAVTSRLTLLSVYPDALAGTDLTAVNNLYLYSQIQTLQVPDASRWQRDPLVPLTGVAPHLYLVNALGAPVLHPMTDGRTCEINSWLLPVERDWVPAPEALLWAKTRLHWWAMVETARQALTNDTTEAERNAGIDWGNITQADIIKAHSEAAVLIGSPDHMRQHVAGLWQAQVTRWCHAGFMPRNADHAAVMGFINHTEALLHSTYAQSGRITPLLADTLASQVHMLVQEYLTKTLARLRTTREISIYFRSYANRWVPGSEAPMQRETPAIVRQLAKMHACKLRVINGNDPLEAQPALPQGARSTSVTYLAPDDGRHRLLREPGEIDHSTVVGYDRDTGGVAILKGTERPFTGTWRGIVKRWPSQEALISYAAQHPGVSVIGISTPVPKTRHLWATEWGGGAANYTPAIMIDSDRLAALEHMSLYLTGNPGERARVIASGFPPHSPERLWAGPVERLLVAAAHGASADCAVSLVDPSRPWDLRCENISFETTMGKWFRTVGNVEVPVELTGEDLRAKAPLMLSKLGRPKSGVRGIIWSAVYRGWVTKVRGWDGAWYEGPVRDSVDDAQDDLISARNHIYMSVPVEMMEDPSLLPAKPGRTTARGWVDFTEVQSRNPQDGLDWEDYRRYAVMEHQLRLSLSQETGIPAEQVNLEDALLSTTGVPSHASLLDRLVAAHAKMTIRAGV